MKRDSVHQVVADFIASREEFTSADLAVALREAGYPELAKRVLDDPDHLLALVNEHAV